MIDTPAIAGVFERLGIGAAEEPAELPEKPAGPDEIPFPPPFHVIPPPRALPAKRVKKLFRGDYPARISVILPATNESVLLRRTVEQFEATLPAGSEILVIDNGSTDGCAEPTLRLEWLPRQGDEPYPVPTLGGGFMAMRHDTLKRAGAFDEGMPEWGSEDVELCLRYWLLGYEAWVVPEVTVLHYFRKQRPYAAEFRLLVHNLLRVALLHFNPARMGRVLTALRNHARFGPALAMAFESDVWQRRADLAARRVRDDDWRFERFGDCCHV